MYNAPTSGEYYIIAKHSGKYLDVQWAGTANGTPVWQWTFTGTGAQKWRFQFVD
ncbi:MAG: RICIN domain-containing protein [Clostridia bacterium]|nr:RICIN domain-containing protein [Clostridia bacterium]